MIPLSLLVVFTDAWLFEGRMVYQRIPTQPEDWPFWTVIFGLPHIIASLITMADREYLNHYRRSLLWPMLLFAGIASAGYLGPQPVSYNLLFVFLGFYTIYHVLAQQLGLTLMMMGVPPCRSYRLWKWLSIIAGMAIYMNVYGERFLGNIWLWRLCLACSALCCWRASRHTFFRPCRAGLLSPVQGFRLRCVIFSSVAHPSPW